MENKNIEEEGIKKLAYYIGINHIVSIELKEAVEGSTILKPKNGYWVKKSAIPKSNAPKKELLTFEEFKKQLPPVQSPFALEDDVMYMAKYDKLTDRTQYFKGGRRNSTKITIKKAYDTYLYDEGKKMEMGGNVDECMIIRFKDIMGDIHVGKIISKNEIKNAFDVIETKTGKEFLVAKSQIVE